MPISVVAGVVWFRLTLSVRQIGFYVHTIVSININNNNNKTSSSGSAVDKNNYRYIHSASRFCPLLLYSVSFSSIQPCVSFEYHGCVTIICIAQDCTNETERSIKRKVKKIYTSATTKSTRKHYR